MVAMVAVEWFQELSVFPEKFGAATFKDIKSAVDARERRRPCK